MAQYSTLSQKTRKDGPPGVVGALTRLLVGYSIFSVKMKSFLLSKELMFLALLRLPWNSA